MVTGARALTHTHTQVLSATTLSNFFFSLPVTQQMSVAEDDIYV